MERNALAFVSLWPAEPSRFCAGHHQVGRCGWLAVGGATRGWGDRDQSLSQSPDAVSASRPATPLEAERESDEQLRCHFETLSGNPTRLLPRWKRNYSTMWDPRHRISALWIGSEARSGLIFSLYAESCCCCCCCCRQHSSMTPKVGHSTALHSQSNPIHTVTGALSTIVLPVGCYCSSLRFWVLEDIATPREA